ncbi:DUF397 domain-containing protein [Streptomyces hesseae]|uniref:DUF397 domain-containing protein n=1 Tax=Streptomyces hesseae TaxID=3075519 RepID=A0ABU2SJ42_9ACTN|nr:DUF397 domain-containing protein [Streptomyces sp. DSM 40473]MDT0448992.1 DUF397 domain-containing protein [Streptomyces sp. DSM 40473]
MSPEPAWQRSSACGGGGNNCLEVRAMTGLIQVRESEAPGTVIAAAPPTLGALLRRVKATSPCQAGRDRRAQGLWGPLSRLP